MRLDELVTGPVYLVTNVLYMYLRADPAYLPILSTFFHRIVRGEIEARIGVPVLDELFYRLLLAHLRDASGGDPLDVLRKDLSGAIAAHGGRIADSIRQLVNLPNMALVGVESGDAEGMFSNIIQHSLLPRDALHLAIMQRLGIAQVASDDRDFDRVTAVERHWIINPAKPNNVAVKGGGDDND